MKLAKWLGRRGVLTGVQITKYLSTLSNLRALRTIVGREFHFSDQNFCTDTSLPDAAAEEAHPGRQLPAEGHRMG